MTAKTTTERQQNRRRLLNEAACHLGYTSWGKLETAVINKEAIIIAYTVTDTGSLEYPTAPATAPQPAPTA